MAKRKKSVPAQVEVEDRRPQKKSQMVLRSPNALTTDNTRVKVLAFRLNRKPETLIRSIEASLQSEVEQQLYLQVAVEGRILPATMEKLLLEFRGDRPLDKCDLKNIDLGNNLYSNRFDDIVEKVEIASGLLDKHSEFGQYPMSAETAAKLVTVYGEYAPEIVSQVIDNVWEIAAIMRMEKHSPRVIVGVALTWIVNTRVPRDAAKGRVGCNSIEELFADFSIADFSKEGFSE